MLWRHFYAPAPEDRGANLIMARTGASCKDRIKPQLKTGQMKDGSPSADGNRITESDKTAVVVSIPEPDEKSADQDLSRQNSQGNASSGSEGDNAANSKELVRVPSSAAVRGGPKSHSGLWATLDKYVVTPVIGPKQAEVCWVSTHTDRTRFVERFGPMFEDYRGHMVVKRLVFYCHTLHVVVLIVGNAVCAQSTYCLVENEAI